MCVIALPKQHKTTSISQLDVKSMRNQDFVVQQNENSSPKSRSQPLSHSGINTSVGSYELHKSVLCEIRLKARCVVLPKIVPAIDLQRRVITLAKQHKTTSISQLDVESSRNQDFVFQQDESFLRNQETNPDPIAGSICSWDNCFHWFSSMG